jgi:hypothetical protein
VPPSVLDALDAAPVSTVQRLVYRARTRPPHRWLRYAPLIALRYLLRTDGLRGSRPWHFPRYVQDYVGVERWWRLPAFLVAWLRASRSAAPAVAGTGAAHRPALSGRGR